MITRVRLPVLLVAALFLCAGEAFAETEEPGKTQKAKVMEAYGELPLYFIQNDGQADERVKYYEKGAGHATFFTREGVYLNLAGSRKAEGGSENEKSEIRNLKSEIVKLIPLNANKNPEMVAEEEVSGRVNYFTGKDPRKWRTDIPTYAKVRYKEVYPGIDLVFYGNQRQLEYDVVVKPGADPSIAAFEYEGVKELKVNKDGELTALLPSGREIIQKKPYIYQEIGGRKVEIQGGYAAYEKEGKHLFRFEVPDYNPRHALVIDPVLSYSTYLGGSGYDLGYGIAVDSSGNAYVTGSTESAGFPTANPYQGSKASGVDVFVTKLSSSGDSLIYSTFLGGGGEERGYGLAVDAGGNVYVTGYTNSSNFPTHNPWQENKAGGYDAFVTKLNAAGNGLVYSTYLGGSGAPGSWDDKGYSIAADAQGYAYVTGYTESSNFPTWGWPEEWWAGADTKNGTRDAFVAILDSTGGPSFSAYLGGSGSDNGTGIGVDAGDFPNIYVTGYTTSTDFPLKDPLQANYGGGNNDAFVTRIDTVNRRLSYSTYLGGSGYDYAYGMAVSSTGLAHVTGWTYSNNFPVLYPMQASHGGGNGDAFVTKINAAGALSYSTYLGGKNDDAGYGIAVDPDGNAYITGGMPRKWASPNSYVQFPILDAFQDDMQGETDAWVVKLNAGGGLSYSSYLGGAQGDRGNGIAVDSAGNAYVTGVTSSSDFPTLNPIQPNSAGNQEVFVTKIGAAAIVTRTLMVNITGPGTGDVSSIPVGIDCGLDCEEAYSEGTVVTLAAHPGADSVFNGWSGDADCSDGVVAMDADKTCTATFNTIPEISINDVTVTEGDSGTTNAVFIVSLSEESQQSVSVDFSLQDDTATAGDRDYQIVSGGPLTFAPGETSKTLTVPVVGDVNVESDETFFVNLTNATNATIADNQGVGTIINDDTTPPSISITDVTVTEGDSGTVDAGFTVTLSHKTNKDVDFELHMNDGSATLGSDYGGQDGIWRIPAGDTSIGIHFVVYGDDIYESDEDFFANITGATNATIADNQGVATIKNDDPYPSLSINDVTVTEGNSGTVGAVFTVTLSNKTDKSVTVNFSAADDTATVADDDYRQISGGPLTFDPLETSKTLTVPVVGDTNLEVNETFFVNLSNATNADIADNRGIGTIIDDDGDPEVSINDPAMYEGDSGTVGLVFTVSLSHESYKTVTVDFSVQDNTATAADPDYQIISGGPLSFAPGETSQTLTVPVVGDLYEETNETFFVNLTNATNATIARAQGEGWIINDDSKPAISINDVTVTEGNSGTVAAVFTVSLSHWSNKTITVDFSVQDNTAMAADDDYRPISGGPLTFQPDETSKTLTVPVVGDPHLEIDETFFVNLTGATNATIADGQGIGTIKNDDGDPSVSIDDVTVTEGNTGTVNMVFTVSLSHKTNKRVQVTWKTQDGSAERDQDYQGVILGVFTFIEGATSETISIEVFGDEDQEPDETFAVVVYEAENATIADGEGTGTIINDDPEPSISINDVFMLEGDFTGQAVFTVSLSHKSYEQVCVRWKTVDETAEGGKDYVPTMGHFCLWPGETSQTVSVTIYGDSYYEQDETFLVRLYDPENASLADPSGVANLKDDDPPPSLSINDVSVDEGGAAVFTVGLSAESFETITVDFQTADGNASAGLDYTPNQGTLSFNPGETSQVITVHTTGDDTYEGDEAFSVKLSNATFASISQDTGEGTIVNDDPAPSLSIDDVTAAEGDAGTRDFVFTVTLSGKTDVEARVDYATADGTATNEPDYAAASGTLTFVPGETSKTIDVAVNGDTTPEGDEVFFVNLSKPVDATITDAQGTGTITDDDTIQLYTLTVTKAGGGTGTATSSPDGIDCGGDCSEEYSTDTMVTLTPTPGADSAFVGWSDMTGCPGLGECRLVMDADRNIAARFELKGDLDGSGNLDLADAILALQISLGIRPTAAFWRAAVDGDGKIDLTEAIFILQKISELR